LTDGQEITYWLPLPTTGNVTLNLKFGDGTSSGAVNCYYGGTTRLTTHYGQGQAIHLTYRKDVKIPSTGSTTYTGWWADANYDSNSNTIDVLQGTYTIPVAGATAGLKQYSLFAEDANGKYSSFTTQNGTAVTKTVNRTDYFDISKIYYCSTGGNYATNANIGTSIVRWAQPLVDLRYTLNIATNALTARKPLYLVFDKTATTSNAIGDTLYKLAGTGTTDWWTQTLPTSADGKIYAEISKAVYDGYRGDLSVTHKYYEYTDKLHDYDSISALKQNKLGMIITFNTSDGTYSCNRTYAEILNYVNSGHTVNDIDAVINIVTSGVITATLGVVESKFLPSSTADYFTFIFDSFSFSLNANDVLTMGSEYYARWSHTHTTANITSFNSAVDARITRDKVLGVISSSAKWTGSYAFVEGRATTASGAYSHVEGYYTSASSTAAHAEGYYSTASGKYSHAEGTSAVASSTAAHAEGYQTTASNTGTHSEGYCTIASGKYSHAEGYNAKATGSYAHAEGCDTSAAYNYTHAENYHTYAFGLASHAEGNETKATGSYAHAEGDGSTASNSASHTEGYHTSASSTAAHAEGYCSTASGKYSHAGGFYTIANTENQTAIGIYNATVADGLFIVGNGTATNARSNAMYVTTAGDMHVAGDIYIANEKVLTGTNNAGFHNSIYRGKSLGTAVTAEQWASIANCTFDDLYIGDYWTLSTTFGTSTKNIRYEIAGFNYWWWCHGLPASLGKPHVVLVPKDHTYGAIMNSTNTTDGGYVHSLMYTTNLTDARTGISALFGDHLYTIKRYFTSAASSGKVTNGALYDSTVDLMSETMVFGHPAWGYSGHEIGTDKTILPLFALNPESYPLYYNSGSNLSWWLCTVGGDKYFSIVNQNGRADCWAASSTIPSLRFVFAIC
jgi:hypothetical protein